MFTALFLVVACARPPLFDETGPDCTPANQLIECQCAECFSWDPSPGAPPAEWYEVLRTNPDGTMVVAGSTQGHNRPAFHYRSGVTVPAVIVTRWCAPWDAQFPHEGQTYRYQVRPCRMAGASITCGPWSAGSIQYTTAPYACYSGGHELACYTGDPVLH